MRKETVRLAEAARALKLTRTSRAAPHCVKIGVAHTEFPDRLADLQAALEEFDKAGAAGAQADAPDQAESMKSAIDAVFRWMRLQGIDTTDPLAILAEALTGTRASKKPPKTLDMMPSFAPGKGKGKGGWKPKLSLGSEFGSRDITDMGANAHARFGSDMQQTVLKLGATAPAPSKPKPSTQDLMSLVESDADEDVPNAAPQAMRA